MKVVSVINYKGGVGKTTLTANLAAYAACLGKRVMLVDMDAQCSLTLSFMDLKQWESLSSQGATLRWWFSSFGSSKGCDPLREYVVDAIRVNQTHKGKLAANRSLPSGDDGGWISLIPSDLDMLDVDLDLARLLYASSESQMPKNFVDLHQELGEQIRKIGGEEGHDIAFLDCPPNFNLVTKMAIVASDDILIPVVPDKMSTRGIPHLIRKRGQLMELFNSHSERIGKNKRNLPAIRAVIPMIWKVSGKGDGDYSRAHQNFVNMLEPQLSDIPDVIFPKGFRHLASFFASTTNIPVLMYPPDIAGAALDENPRSKSSYVEAWKSVADTVQEVGKILGLSAPSGVQLSKEWQDLSMQGRRPSYWRNDFVGRICRRL